MFGGLFSRLFGGKKREPVTNEINWPEIAPDDVLNCCEQVGAFDEVHVEDSATINKVCQDIARIFNSAPKSNESLRQAFVNGFKASLLYVSENTAWAFVSAYIESYINN